MRLSIVKEDTKRCEVGCRNRAVQVIDPYEIVAWLAGVLICIKLHREVVPRSAFIGGQRGAMVLHTEREAICSAVGRGWSSYAELESCVETILDVDRIVVPGRTLLVERRGCEAQ